MRKFTIHIETTRWVSVTVEAPSREAARESAQRDIDRGVLPSGEMEGSGKPATHTRITNISYVLPDRSAS